MDRARRALASLLMAISGACIELAERLDPIELPPDLDERVNSLVAAAIELERQELAERIRRDGKR